jgi:hypothetical protein
MQEQRLNDYAGGLLAFLFVLAATFLATIVIVAMRDRRFALKELLILVTTTALMLTALRLLILWT